MTDRSVMNATIHMAPWQDDWQARGVVLEDLRQQRRRRAFAHRRVASAGPSRGAGTIAGGASAVGDSA